MTDLNKLRSEFESDLADHLIERDANGFYINDEIQNYWEKHLLKAQIKELKAELEKAKAQAVPEWISVEVQMPESLRNVLVLLDANPAKNQNQMVAHFIPKFTEEYHGDDDWYDYDEDRGCGYVKEGWYANTAYIGDEYSSYFIEEKVTHWKPLKEASESGAEQ